MFAQTGIESTSSNAVPSTDAASSAIWWLIPVAIGCLGLIWYLRRLTNSAAQTVGRNDSQKRTSAKAKLVTADEPDDPTANEPDRHIHSSKSSSKKKGQANNQRNAKKPKEKQVDSKVVAKSVAEPKVSSEQLSRTESLAEQTMEAKASAVPQAASPPPVPVAAIFEPLRSVAPPRRKVSALERQAEEVKPKSVSDESVSRSATGGKFERMVPSTAYSRAAANRWPASMTNSVERTVPARPIEARSEPKPLSSVAAVSIPEVATAAPSAPQAKGLKSFVSKLRTATTTESESESIGNDSNLVTAREEHP